MNKPEQSIITSLLEKHALGICTREEMAILEQWYAAFPEKGTVWHDDTEKAGMKDSLKAKIFDEIAPAKIRPISQARAKRSRRIWWQVAAVVNFLLVTYVLYKYIQKKEPAYVVVSAAAGKGIIKLELPDHSEVWLEPGTLVRYRKDFGKTGREVELTNGMAFFSVRKNERSPFLVKAPGGVQTKVLGTEFTVKSYLRSKEVQVMVSSGIVQVSDSTGVLGVLRANQQLRYEQDAHVTTRTEGALHDWRTGDIVLNNASFTEIARILETRYGLRVTYNTRDVATYRFTLRIGKNMAAADMLGMLKDISGLTYTLNGNKVTIH